MDMRATSVRSEKTCNIRCRDLRLAALMCGKAVPFRSGHSLLVRGYASSESNRGVASKIKIDALQKGAAFPHIRRRSRRNFTVKEGKQPQLAVDIPRFFPAIHTSTCLSNTSSGTARSVWLKTPAGVKQVGEPRR